MVLCDQCGELGYPVKLTWKSQSGTVYLCEPHILAMLSVPRLNEASGTGEEVAPQQPNISALARAWARSQGMETPSRGRMPARLIEAYQDAMGIPEDEEPFQPINLPKVNLPFNEEELAAIGL